MNNSYKLSDYYRRPAILAVGLHALIALFLIGSVFFYHPSQYSAEQKAIQATIVTTNQLAAMMQPHVSIKPAKPVEKVEPPKPLPTPPKPIPPKPIPPKPIPQKNNSVKPITQKINPKVAQKALEESLLQDDLNTPAPKTPAKNTAKSMQQALMEQQLAADEGEVKSAATAAHSKAVQGEIDKYKAIILQQIQQNWIVPQNVQELSCLLQVQVAPGGMVTNVTLLKSSGNEALDRSAIAAVNKASPLSVPKDSAAFEAFRTFTLTVKPEGSELAAN